MNSGLRLLRHHARRVASLARHRPVATMIVALGASVSGITGAGNLLSRAVAEAPQPVASSEVSHETPDDLLDARSPGARTYGWLVQNKVPRTGFDVGPPHERVLTSVRRRPGSPVVPGTSSVVTPYTPVGAVIDTSTPTPAEGALVDSVDPTAPDNVLVPGNSGIAVVSGPGGSGGAPVTGGDPGTTVPSIPAVPEPGTWTMLLLGFVVIGAMMRQRRDALSYEAS